MNSLSAKFARAAKSITSMAIFSIFSSLEVPALPGATNTFSTAEDCAHFQARECSLPPEPIINTFILMPEVA